ncbi:tyrosine-type recombinase/integrase [candidate division CSSED10-310 bacterium]|uniref:Tyrosine-type recombinase/integrase n=1 Tax=candidate division CSSED10-310 bacterium TaxID=2855610 RepID=A0ABV6YQV6_UNCC1
MIGEHIEKYIEIKRSLGFKYRVQATLLRSYARFAEIRGDQFVYTKTVLEWATLAPSRAQRRNRLLTIRRFALVMSADDQRHQIPPDIFFGKQTFKRRKAFIFTDEQIARLLRSAAELKPIGSIRPACYTTLFGLIAATGLRISEALALSLDDISQDGLIIQSTKFNKSRLVPIHETVQDKLEWYLKRRKKVSASDRAVFVSHGGKSLKYSTVVGVFLQLARSIGLREGPGIPGPTIHDLRHTFAVRSLEQCHRNEDNSAQHISSLSTYLGHAHITDTYWYLQAAPRLMKDIAQESQLHFGGNE